MFGYVKVNADELKVADYRLYKSIYCGLCKTMKKELGITSTFGLSYDFVFLAIICADASGDGFNVKPGRCGLHLFKKRPIADSNRALSYAGCAQAVLKYYKLCDDISDSGFWKRTLLKILLPGAKRQMRRAIKTHPEYELEALSEKIKTELEALSALEREGSPSCERNAEVFGRLLASVFAYFSSDFSESAKVLGYHVGRFIYIADALDDFARDKKTGVYNPFCAALYSEPPFDLIGATLSKIGENATKALSEMPHEFDDLRRISENIIRLGLPSVYMAVCRKNEEKK